MPKQADQGPQSYRRVALIATGLAVGLITLGGVVRITGSGMGCGDHWPLCNGRLVPNLSDALEVIEWSHRWVAAMLSATVVCLALIAWRKHRHDGFLRAPAFGALGLLVVQVLLGAITVKLGTAAPAVVIHLTTAMLLLSLLVVCTLRAGERLRTGDETFVPGRGPNAALFATGFALVVILFGAFVANYDAGLQCLGFPLCGGTLTLPELPLARLQWVHRVLAFLFVGHCFGVALGARRYTGDGGGCLSPSSLVAVRPGGTAGTGRRRNDSSAVADDSSRQPPVRWVPGVDFGGGAEFPLSAARPLPRSTRWLGGSPARRIADWGGGCGSGFDVLAGAEPPREHGPAARRLPRLRPHHPDQAPDHFAAAAHHRAADVHHRPRAAALVPGALGMLGGYLMAGGANTVNMWFDRDIDMLMARTKLRPIPSGRISRLGGAALRAWPQGAVAFWVFWRSVNPLSAWLAFSGYLFYVFIYTAWLKRLTSQNIVIGGAAGAFPPLVGWTAMTGTLDLPAIYLFAIIFFWTPPHFWALALIKRQDYAKAGIPMMPVVQGERWTKVQMLAYTLMLIPLTADADGIRGAGTLLRRGRLALGGRLLWYSVKVLRESERARRRRGRCTSTRCSTLPCSSWPWAWTGQCPSDTDSSVLRFSFWTEPEQRLWAPA